MSATKRWIGLYFGALLAILVPVAAFNFYADPFTLFRRDGLYLSDSKFSRYVNAGLVRTADQGQVVVVGNSYIANVDPELIARLFGGTALIHSQWGLGQGEVNLAANYVLAHQPEARIVFFQTPIWDVCSTQLHPTTPLPPALYSDYPWALASYLLSEQTSLESVAKLRSDPRFQSRPDAVYRWWEANSGLVGKKDRLEKLFASVKAPESKQALSQSSFTDIVTNSVDCFERFAVDFTSRYPDKQFYFFNPPHFQWLLWDRYQIGLLEPQIAAMEQIARYVETIPNAHFFDFYPASEWTTDCRHWLDLSHFDLEVSDAMFFAMSERRYERTGKTNAELTERTLKSLQHKSICH